jgi:hypothetical protein
MKHPEVIQELYIWQILGGDPDVGFPKGLMSFFDEFMTSRQWTKE